MRLQTKLILVFLFLAFAPVAFSGYMIVQILDKEVTRQRDLSFNERLATLSQNFEYNLRQVGISLRLSLEIFDLPHFQEEERQGMFRLLYRQRPYLNLIQLLDSQSNPLGAPVHIPNPSDLQGAFAGHQPVSQADVRALLSLQQPVPLSELHQRAVADADGLAWGEPLFLERSSVPQLPLLVYGRRPDGSSAAALVLVSLAEAAGVARALDHFSNSARETRLTLFLVDGQDRILHRAGPDARQSGETLSLPEALTAQVHSPDSGQLRWELNEVSRLICWYPLSLQNGLRIVTLQLADEVYRAETATRQRIVFWLAVSIVIVVVFGPYFSRTLSNPIQELAAGVLDVARGKLDTRVEVQSSDEIGELAETFNYMAGELKQQKVEIERQSGEIRNWNRELQGRVEARTRELKEAQSYLVHSQKLAAVAELGSGVAHELNNPLAAVLGFTQILVQRHTRLDEQGQPLPDPDLKTLKKIEEQTQRCRTTVSHLLRFSQEQVDRGAYEQVDLADVVVTVLRLFEGSFASAQCTVTNRLGSEKLLINGNRAQLLQAFLQIFHAIRPMLGRGQELVIESSVLATEVHLVFSGPMDGLTSPELDIFQRRQNKDQAMAQGLGLWLAQQIVTEHKGMLSVSGPASLGPEGSKPDGARPAPLEPVAGRSPSAPPSAQLTLTLPRCSASSVAS